MTTTRTQVEAALAHLKRREGFRLRARERNRAGDSFAVFTDVDDEATFDPSLEHDAPGFVAWTKAAGRALFDPAGALTRPLVARWAGDGGLVQLAFARAGLSARVEHDARPAEGYAGSGRLSVAPDADARPSDLRALLAAFARLEEDGVAALVSAPPTRSAGWEDVSERTPGGPAVFFTAQDLRTLDPAGDLAGTLHLAWRGDAAAIVRALGAAGLAARAPAAEDEAIAVTAPPGRAPRAAEQVEAPVPAKPRRRARRAAGPLEEVARYRSPDRKPVAALGLGPPGLLALVQEGDTRGPPARVVSVVALDTGEVRVAFPTALFAAASRPRFLPDGRLVVGVREQEASTGRLHAFAWDPTAPDAPVVPIASGLNQWGTEDGLVSVDAAGTHVAVTRRDGLTIHPVPPRGAPWSTGAVVLARGTCAYPATVVGPGGAFVLWWEASRQPLSRLERTGRGHSTWDAPIGAARRLQLDPRGERVLFQRWEEPAGAFLLRALSAADGAEALPGLGEVTRGAGGFAFSPAGDLLGVGLEDGRLRLLAYPSLEPRGEQPVFAKGALAALALDASGLVAAGSSKGEVAVLRLPT